MIRKTFEAIETKILDEQTGVCQTMFAITGNVDRQNDRILAGAFAKALAAKGSVPVCYAHKWDDLDSVLGRTLNWTELMPGSPDLPQSLLAKGLGGVRATVQFEMGVPAGRVAFTHVKNRNLTDWSWAFDIDPTDEKFEDGTTVREIKSIKEIYEVTLALIGANPATTTMAFKAMVEAESKAQPDNEELICLLQAAVVLLAD